MMRMKCDLSCERTVVERAIFLTTGHVLRRCRTRCSLRLLAAPQVFEWGCCHGSTNNEKRCS